MSETGSRVDPLTPAPDARGLAWTGGKEQCVRKYNVTLAVAGVEVGKHESISSHKRTTGGVRRAGLPIAPCVMVRILYSVLRRNL